MTRFGFCPLIKSWFCVCEISFKTKINLTLVPNLAKPVGRWRQACKNLALHMKIKRNKIDTCNICRETKLLSWDHVPPKGGINLTSVEIKGMFQVISGREDNIKRISQNGVKYRTICSDCNSTIGFEYDPTLNEFNRLIIDFIQSTKILPQYISIKVKPIRLMKAVLAHILSAKLNIDEVVTDKEIRETIFSKDIAIPKKLHIYYWIYPYDCTVILRDFAVPVELGNYSNCTFCQVIKYFPIAFIVTDSDSFRDLESLSKYRELKIDDEIDLLIDLSKVKEFNWPEKVDENNIIFMSQESQNGIFARPR